MELQAGNNKATKDFLSLYKRDSSSTSIPRGDTTRTPPRPPPPPPPPHGFSLKTQDFLCPLERKTMAAGREGQRLPPDINVPVEPPEGPPAEFVPPGGIETYSIRHVPTTCSSSSFGAVVKSEWGAETRAATTTTMTAGEEPTSTSSTVIAGGAFRLWEESFSREKGLKGGAIGGVESCIMMDAESNVGKVFTDDDEDEKRFGRRDGAPTKELSMRVEQKHNNEQKPSTPRSKHSATEQRRRSKINDRFQILRDLIPHSDQKRDKASFLLEVIEYIQFLQEKVQKYELEFPGWNQDATCMMPWQRNPQVPVDGVGDPSRTMKNGQVPIGFVNSANVAVPNGTMLLRNGQAPSEPANANSAIPGKATPFTVPMQQAGEASGFAQPQQRLISEAENMAYPLPSQCVRSDTGGGQVLDKDLTIDVGTVSISSAYSQGVMNALAQSLQNSGIDLSQASISVKINLGRRASSKPASVAMEHQDPSDNQMVRRSRSGSSEDESGKVNKRQKQATN